MADIVIQLSNGDNLTISEQVVAQDPRWRERLKEYLAARSQKLYRKPA